MGKFVASLDDIKAAIPGLAILIVHHSGKDSAKGERGSTALRGAADAVMQLTKKGPLLFLKSEKQKDAGPFDEHRMVLTVVALPTGGSSCVVGDALVPASDEPKAAGRDPRSEDSERRVLSALARFGSTGALYSELKEAAGLSPSTFKDVRARLVNSRRARQTGRRYYPAETGPKAGTGPENTLPAQAA